MRDYIKNHWVVLLLILLIWALTFCMISNNHYCKIHTKAHFVDTVSIKKDSILKQVDSIVTVIEVNKKIQKQEVKTLKKEKADLENVVKIGKKKIKIQEELLKKKPTVQIQEVEVSPKVMSFDASNVFNENNSLKNENNELKEENKKLKADLELSEQKIKKYKIDLEQLIRRRSDSIVIDTLRKKKRRFFNW